MRQSNKNGLGYTCVTSSVATTSKTVFVKTAIKIENTLVSGKNSNSLLPECKKKIFVPTCHYCNKPGHIRPKYFKYRNTLRMIKNVHKPRSRKYRLKIRF